MLISCLIAIGNSKDALQELNLLSLFHLKGRRLVYYQILQAQAHFLFKCITKKKMFLMMKNRKKAREEICSAEAWIRPIQSAGSGSVRERAT